MATEADQPEGLESVSVMKIKEEMKELECSHLDTMVSKASSMGELQKAGNEHCSLTSETVEKSINTEDSDVVSQNFNNNVNNHILEGKLGSTEGETFSKSTSVATGASDGSMQGSEIEDREKLALVQKEDAMTNKDVEEAHDIITMNNIVALDEHDTSMNLENFEDGKQIHSSKLPSEVNTMEISTAENYLSVPNITSTSLDQSVQKEKFEGREGETIVEEKKQTSEESSDDRRTLLEETDKEEIRLHQHVESSTAESYEQTSAITEEVASVSQKDESEGKTEDPSFELREQVGQTVEATLDHCESLKKLEVSKDESTGLVILTNDEDKEKNCDSSNTPTKQDVVYGDVTQTNEQEETILLKAEPEEKDKQECASSQALKDIKEAEKPCQEEVWMPIYVLYLFSASSPTYRVKVPFIFRIWVLITLSSYYTQVPIRHETADANEYTDNQIIQEEVATKYQPFTVSYEEEIVQSCQADEEVEMKQDTKVN
ncbi:hypothetical protein MKW94_005574 [Papaver nudicaule]|uniref:Uncharacterized protein n=1 Tax=Papaver nudicaule TaxID=74823 RepID=A0AA41S5F4_PAPNU|nr:hypothetical protein [Papaver nudicaule]